MFAARSDIESSTLVDVERGEGQCLAQAGMELVRERRGARFRGGHGLDMRGLLPFEQLVPGGGANGHPPIEARCGYPRVVKRVSCMPSGPPTRTFRSFQGVVTAPAALSP